MRNLQLLHSSGLPQYGSFSLWNDAMSSSRLTVGPRWKWLLLVAVSLSLHICLSFIDGRWISKVVLVIAELGEHYRCSRAVIQGTDPLIPPRFLRWYVAI